MKALLIQVRDNPVVLEEEYQSFLRYSQLSPDELIPINVFEKIPTSNDLNDIDGVFIGGASEANVLEPHIYKFMPGLIEFIKICIDESIPTFASCFGFQAAVLALGGEIVDDRENYEMGTIKIELTPASKSDILYQDTPNNFYAVSVHQQKAVEIPRDCQLLAKTDICIHSFKVIDRPFWAFQFHPEVDRQTLVDRLKIYEKKYTSGPSQYEDVIQKAEETFQSNLLVKKFVERVLIK